MINAADGGNGDSLNAGASSYGGRVQLQALTVKVYLGGMCDKLETIVSSGINASTKRSLWSIR